MQSKNVNAVHVSVLHTLRGKSNIKYSDVMLLWKIFNGIFKNQEEITH
jgi:hypothetical protein